MTFLSAPHLLGMLLLWFAAHLSKGYRTRQALYLFASYLFYYTFGPEFFSILLASTLFNYFWGGLLRRRSSSQVLALGVLLNLALLSTFKYLPGFAALWADSSSLAGSIATLALPVGISFWTFQGLSYLFDQYRGEDLDPSLLEFCVYMSFAPTVLSGPICRVSDLIPQLREPFRGNWENVCAGAQSIWIGIWMITLARLIGYGTAGEGVSWAFEQTDRAGSIDVWIMVVGYGFQLFFDFAGYSRLVIGIAQLFGIRLPENFNRPYLAVTPTMFWQRWHMSLSFWIRDYLFMPLAMVRRDMWWRNSMLVLSMVVFGLWHKATWLFLLWGLYQGSLLLAHRLWQQHVRLRIALPEALSTGLSWLITFIAINIGWILFRAKDIGQAQELLGKALSHHSGLNLSPNFYLLVFAVVGGYFAFNGLAAVFREKDSEVSVLAWIPVEARFALYALIFYMTVFRSAEPQAFIYFQF